MGGPDRIDGGRVGILPGSFNPPTIAHMELAGAAQRRFDLDHVVFSLSSAIVDKERLEGLCREDRLLLLSLMAQQHPWAAVAVVNRGLYSEQVPAFRSAFGGGADLWFIVGMDKVLQIFDPKYYDDRDRALNALFAHARLIAANREDWGGEELRALLEEPRNALDTRTGSIPWRFPPTSRTSPRARSGTASRAGRPGRTRFLRWRGISSPPPARSETGTTSVSRPSTCSIPYGKGRKRRCHWSPSWPGRQSPVRPGRRCASCCAPG